MKKTVKILQYSQESFRPATLLKTQVFSSEYYKIFKNTNFKEQLLSEQLLLY